MDNTVKKLSVGENGMLQESNIVRIQIPTELRKVDFIPNRGRLLLDPIPMKQGFEANQTGIIIPAKYLQDPEMKGIVVAMAPGVEGFELGDVVCMGSDFQSLPNPTFIDGHAYMLVFEGSILGKYANLKVK